MPADKFSNLVAIEKIRKFFIKDRLIISAYVYGSFLTNQFNSKKSDVDILIICRDTDRPELFLKRIKSIHKKISELKLDINVVFYSEFIKRWHIYRAPTYFIGIKHRNKLICGKDILSTIDDKEVSVDDIYKRVVDLAQGSRGVYINGKDPDFWVNLYSRWLKISLLEVLFLTGELDLSYDSGLNKISKTFPELKSFKLLLAQKQEMEIINKLAEKLRVFMEKKIINKKT